LLFLTIIIIAACSPKSGSGLLKFMFDGVPERKGLDSSKTLIVSSSTDSSKLGTKTNSTAAVQSNLFIHPPYKERACNQCHNPETPGKMPFSQDEACYKCHDDFQKKYAFVHGPVAGGFCTTCHAPHFSDNKKLLISKGQDLCLKCHDIVQVLKNKDHEEIGKTNCTECHNPHGGNDKYLMN
jgi:predicted CXXCH cytochrome family protein